MDSGAENKVQSVVHPVVDLIVAASKKDSEESRGSIKSDFTVTELLLPPRIYVLMQQHHSQIVESAESWFNMLMGSAIHEYIARLLQRYPQFRREERLTISVASSMPMIRWPWFYMISRAQVFGQSSITINQNG